MKDISQAGCKIRGTLGFAQVGDRVTMKVAGINTPLGKIAWVEDRVAGVEFDGEMHPAIIDYICSQNSVNFSA